MGKRHHSLSSWDECVCYREIEIDCSDQYLQIWEDTREDMWDDDDQTATADPSFDTQSEASTSSGFNSPLADRSTQNISQFNVSNTDETDERDDQNFKKHLSLKAYFTKRFSGNNVRVLCKGCNKERSNSSYNRLMAHISVCSGYTTNQKRAITAAAMPVLNECDEKNLGWTAFCVENNIAFKVVESGTLKDFARLVNWTPPSRTAVVKTYLYELDRRAKASLSQTLLSPNSLFLSIEFDHAQSSSMRHLLGIVATGNQGERYLLKVQDDSLIGSAAENIKTGVINAIRELPPYTINSFVSDSASSCKKARDLIVENEAFKHAISHRCLAHLFNLIGKEFQHERVCPKVNHLIKWAGKIVALVARSTLYTAKLEQAGLARVKAYTPTRWYSLTATLEALSAARSLITEEFKSTGDQYKISLVSIDRHWDLLAKVIPLLKPLVDCIGVAERSNGTVGEAIRALLLYIGKLWTIQDSCPLVRAMITAILTYFSPDKLGKTEYSIILACYATDRRYNVDYLTKTGLAKVMVGLMFVADKEGYQRDRVINELSEDYNKFTSQLDDFGRLPLEGETASAWWSKAPKAQVLTRVALRLAHLRSSSANIERTFSKLKMIHSLSRYSLNVDTIEKCMSVHFERERAQSRKNKLSESEVIALKLTPEDILSEIEPLIDYMEDDSSNIPNIPNEGVEEDRYYPEDANYLSTWERDAALQKAEEERRDKWKSLTEKFAEDFNFTWTRALAWTRSDAISDRVGMVDIERIAYEACQRIDVASSRQ